MSDRLSAIQLTSSGQNKTNLSGLEFQPIVQNALPLLVSEKMSANLTCMPLISGGFFPLKYRIFNEKIPAKMCKFLDLKMERDRTRLNSLDELLLVYMPAGSSIRPGHTLR